MTGLNKIGLNQVQLNRLHLNAPFPTYRKMAGGGGSGDGFPVLPGDVTRWHFGGLTNEMMAAMDDPRLEDADGKGRFLSFKNFLWAGMSGVNGYMQNFNQYFVGFDESNKTVSDSSMKLVLLESDSQKVIYDRYSHQIGYTYNFYIKVTGIEGRTLNVNAGTLGGTIMSITEDGIYSINATVSDSWGNNMLYLIFPPSSSSNTVTIDQLPLYPGFILGDGVDDFAVTEKELNFEDTYTVYTAFIPFQDDPARNMILCGKNETKDFSINYSGTHINFQPSTGVNLVPRINQFMLLVCKRNKDTTTIINLFTGESRSLSSKEFIANPGLYYLWRNVYATFLARAAIAGQTICNGHFSTDEEDEKVLNYYKQEYPWLFPAQAWTVVGKTNEDTDRATIANITGNGNNLVLSNFGFAENSGYGLYGFKFIPKSGIEYYSGSRISFSKYQLSQISLNPYLLISPGESYTRGVEMIAKIKITGLKEGISITWGWGGVDELIITEDGTYIVSAGEGKLRQMTIVYAEDFDPNHIVTIEQIPDYEGYLVTDGVDDKIMSSAFTMGKDFTAVGEWAIIDEIDSRSGISKDFSLKILGKQNGLWLFINDPGNSIVIETKSLKAVCSDGRVYLNDWIEVVSSAKQRAPGSNNSMDIGFVYNDFAQMVFKNLAIYPTVLSKEDCIKAYNYLQTLKAKI